MTMLQLLTLAVKVLDYTPHEKTVTPELVAAFAMVESSGRITVRGDKQKAYGLYQFHMDRWVECGGSKDEFGRADAEYQTWVMIRALNRYSRNAKKEKTHDPLTWIANCHNLGHGSNSNRMYVVKIATALAAVKEMKGSQ